MTVSAVVATIMIGLSLAGAPTPSPSDGGSQSGGISVGIPLVSGVNDGGSTGGGSSGSGGSGGSGNNGGSGGSGGGSGGPGGGTGGGNVCTVINPPSAPVPASGPAANAAHLIVRPSHVAQGSQVSLRLGGYQPGEKIQIVSYPGARVLGNLTARGDGTLDSSILVPRRFPTGPTTIEATGWADCRVGSASLLVVSPSGSGSSIMPWFAWLIALSGLGIAGICIVIANQLGWLSWFPWRRKFGSFA